MAEQTTIGVEIDGNRLTVVEVAKGHAVSVRTLTGSNMTDAVQLLLGSQKQKRGDAPVRMSLATPGMRMRRMDVSSQLKVRRNFEDAVYAGLNATREGSTTAGLFFNAADLIGDTISGGVGVVGPESPVLAAYKAAGKVRTEIVAPPLSMIGANGLWLGFRYETADLTLVIENQPVAYRQLPTGGLNNVIRRLGEGGEDRMRAVISGGGMSDPVAAAELEMHLRQLVEDVDATVNFFQREGEATPMSLCVFGPGSSSGITRMLTERGYQVEMPEWLSKRLAYLPLQDREEAVGAFFAAATAGVGLPQVAFVNPDAARLAQELARRDQRAKYLLGGVVVAALVAIIGVGPLVRAWFDTRSAKADLAAAETRLSQYQVEDTLLRDIKDREAALETLAENEIPWVDALDAVYGTAPGSARIVNLTATGAGSSVTLTISIESAGGYAELAGWLNTLTEKYGNGSAWSSNFSTRDGLTVYELRLTYTAAAAGTSDTEDTEPAETGADQTPAPETTTEPTPEPTPDTSSEGAGE